MAYSEELIDQATRLLLVSTGLPVGEAEVRRAISCAYYALFHLLVEAATELLCPEQPVQLRRQFRRAFVHADMRSVCKQFESGVSQNLSAAMRDLFSDPIEPALLKIAKAFRELQLRRHAADYDLDALLTASDAELIVAQARSALAAWQTVRTTNNAKAFLTALLLHRHWKRD